MSGIPGEITALIICCFLAAAGALVMQSAGTMPMLFYAGLIFLIGGIAGAAASIYSLVR